MVVARFEHADEARAALSAIVSDPALGADALKGPDTIANLLGDYLPDAPREAGLLVAAVKAGIPAALADHAAQGTDVAIAVRLAAESMAARTAYTSDACEWAASELAIAFAAATTSAELADPADLPDVAEAVDAEHGTIGIGQFSLAPAGSDEVLAARFGDWKRLALVFGAVVLVLVAVAAFGAAYLAGRRSPVSAAGSQHSTTSVPVTRQAQAPCAREPVSRALVAENTQLKSFRWRLVSYACEGGWAAALIYAPSVGHGEAFLLRGASDWVSDPINGGIYQCSDLRKAFVVPLPPQTLALRLFRKVGLCRTQ